MKIIKSNILTITLLIIIAISNCALKKKHKFSKKAKSQRVKDSVYMQASSSASSSSSSSMSSSMSSSQQMSSSSSSMSSSMSSSQQMSSSFSLGFQSDSVYDSGETLELARCIAGLIFEEGTNDFEAQAKKRTLDNCFVNINNNIERSTPYLRRFFEECNKVSRAPLILWNNLIFESTILQALKEYTVPSNRNLSCDQALLPFAQPYTTSHYSDMDKCFKRSFDGHSNIVVPTGGKAQFLKGPVANRRERLPNNFFRNLNAESRK
jgi:hypothetical protein